MATTVEPSNRTKITNTSIDVPAREKKRLSKGKSQDHKTKKTKKVLEAGNLRAFYKMYIIDNKRFICYNVELMYWFRRRSAGICRGVGVFGRKGPQDERKR